MENWNRTFKKRVVKKETQDFRRLLFIHQIKIRMLKGLQLTNEKEVFLGKTYDVSPFDSQRSHPSMDLGVKWDLCVLFVQTAVNCKECKFV